jgi:DNA-binding transcriptional regulator YdaS (Cro superfamily)
MIMTNKRYNNLLKKHGEHEVASNFIFPSGLTGKQKVEANTALTEALVKRRAGMSEADKLNVKLLQLRFQIEDYLNDVRFDKNMSFSFFLKSYIKTLQMKQSQLAREIAIKPSVLSQYINSHRIPPENVIIRLELHSNNIIPATNWYLLLGKEKVHELGSNKTLRNKQKPFVKKEPIQPKQGHRVILD